MTEDAETQAPHSLWPRELIAGELTGAVIGAFFEVYKILGPGFLEDVYANALATEFHIRGILYERELPMKVFYKGREAGSYRADFFVEETLMLELKADKAAIEPGKAQLLNYLRATETQVGLVLRFGPQKGEFDRVINTRGCSSVFFS